MGTDECKCEVRALIQSFLERGADPETVKAAMAHGLFEITADSYRSRKLYTKDHAHD